MSRVICRLLLAPMTAMGLATIGIEGAGSPKIEIRFEMVANPVDVRQGRSSCTFSVELETGTKGMMRGAFGEVLPDAVRQWKAAGSGVRCDEGADGVKGSRPAGSSGTPYLLLEASVTPLKPSGSTVNLAVLLSTRKLAGFSRTGEPIYREATERRTLTLENRRGRLIPILVADPGEEEGFGIHDLMLRVGARALTAQATEYGAVSIRTDAAGAEILLDGGRVGRTSQEKTALLRNVPAGDREVVIRVAPRREARRLVRVHADRTVLVALGITDPLTVPSNGLARIGRNDQGYEEYRRKRDDAVMVKVPEGEFLMGNLDTEGRPLPHTVYASTFLMDKIPVTWGQYKRFLEASGQPLPPHEPYWGILEDHPAVFVTWEESRAYCEWVGGRLPTEAEREKAARGRDNRKYPWGDQEPDPELAVFRRNWGSAATAPVGSRPAGASPYGLLDMAGNVWEWCEDWYDPQYYEISPGKDPRGPAAGRSRVVRGGSWDSRPSVLSCSSRNFGYVGYREGDFGFRCASDPP